MHKGIVKIFYSIGIKEISRICYSIKLNKLFTDPIKIVSKYPGIGKLTDKENIRIKIVRDYLIIYEDLETEIHILTIWDSRRDSENLEY